MLSVHGRKPAAVVVEPIAKAFLKLGLTPNVVTVVGTMVTIAISVILIPTGHLFSAAVLSGLFAAFDMLDGTQVNGVPVKEAVELIAAWVAERNNEQPTEELISARR